jgi:hypothetical protein
MLEYSMSLQVRTEGQQPGRPGFVPSTVRVGFMEEEVALGQGFLLVILPYPVTAIPPLPMLSVHP